MILEEFLADTIATTRAAAIKLPSGQDLRPQFVYFRPDGDFVVVDITEGMESAWTKEILAASCRARLREERATAYALITPAWAVVRTDPSPEAKAELERVFNEEGSGGRYRDERREIYWIQCCDRQRTLTAALYVKRDYKGKIRDLERDPATLHEANRIEGRMTNWFDAP